MRRSLICVGVILLFAQLGVIAFRRLDERTPKGPRVGALLPDHSVRRLSGERLAFRATLSGGCHLVVFISTTCPVCKDMRMTWWNKFVSWRDSLNIAIEPLWVFWEPEELVNGFFQGIYRVPTVLLLGNHRKAIAKFGVFGTPLSYLVDGNQRLQAGVVGNRFPELTKYLGACR